MYVPMHVIAINIISLYIEAHAFVSFNVMYFYYCIHTFLIDSVMETIKLLNRAGI